MKFGARSFGTRTFGDGEGDSGFGSPPPVETDPITTLVGTSAFSITGDVAQGTDPITTLVGTSAFSVVGRVGIVGEPISFEATSSFFVAARFENTDYQYVVVDSEGNAYGELVGLTVGPLVKELCAHGSFEWSMDPKELSAAIAEPIARELQVWKGPLLLAQGPITSRRGGPKAIQFQAAANPLWYFGKRFFGTADRVNWVPNGDFEMGEAGWHFGYTLYSEQQYPPGHSIVNFPTVTGTKALRLEGYVQDHDSPASQQFEKVADYALGDYWTLAGWIYVPSADYVGTALEERGLYLERFSTTEVHPDPQHVADWIARGWEGLPMASLGIEFFPINADTPKDEWVRAEVSFLASTDPDGEIIQTRLYPPVGVAIYDAVTLTLAEALTTGVNPMDVADIISMIVDYAQDRWPAFQHGKSDLNIDVDAPATGTLATRHYLMSEHGGILQAILDFVEIEGGVDIDVVCRPGIGPDHRFFTVYDKKGRELPWVLEYGGLVADFGEGWDGNAAASDVVILGPGDGSDREEGGARDSSVFGGVTVEHVEVAPDGTSIDRLDEKAREALRLRKNPAVLELVITEPSMVGMIDTGDTARVVIDHGIWDIDATYRIVRISLDPNTDRQVLTVNLD